MSDLLHELSALRGRRVRVLGVGNPERGDDGFGVRLAAALGPRLGDGPADTLDAGTTPERYVGVTAEEGFEAVILADAARFGGAPGALLFASTEELAARPPAAATHRVPLAVLAQYAEGLGMRAFLLAVEPAALCGASLTPTVARTLRAAVEVLATALGPATPRSCFDKLSTSGGEREGPLTLSLSKGEPVEGRAEGSSLEVRS